MQGAPAPATDSRGLQLSVLPEAQASDVQLLEASRPRVSRRACGRLAIAAAVGAYLCAALAVDFARALPLAVAAALLGAYVAARRVLPDVYSRSIAAGPCIPRFERRTVLVLRAALVAVHVALVAALNGHRAETWVAMCGLGLLLAVSTAASVDRAAVRWRPVAAGLLLQFWLAILLLRTGVGVAALGTLSCAAQHLLSHARAGGAFVFGEALVGGSFAFGVLPIVVFVSALCAVLLHAGILRLLFVHVGGALAAVLAVSPAEGVVGVANVFLAMTEAPLLLRPVLADLDRAQLFCVMVGGFASVAGSVLGAYIAMGIHAPSLLAACAISAPAALAIAKIVVPDDANADGRPAARAGLALPPGASSNVVQAAADGALAAVPICANIAASLIGFLALLSLADAAVGYLGGLVGAPSLSLSILVGRALAPVALLLGVPPEDCVLTGELLGAKMLVNEFVAYGKLAAAVSDGAIGARAATVATYALCGFSNLGAMGIMIGVLSGISAELRPRLTRDVFRALLAGAAIA